MIRNTLIALVLVLFMIAVTACGKNDEDQGEVTRHSSDTTDQAGSAGTAKVSQAETVAKPSKKFSNFDPDPIQVCDGSGLGQTTIGWAAPGVSAIEVRINSLDGPLMARGESGSKETGKWVTDGMIFMLVDSSNGDILDQITVEHTQEGCP